MMHPVYAIRWRWPLGVKLLRPKYRGRVTDLLDHPVHKKRWPWLRGYRRRMARKKWRGVYITKAVLGGLRERSYRR
jgi:hypothetical protein